MNQAAAGTTPGDAHPGPAAEEAPGEAQCLHLAAGEGGCPHPSAEEMALLKQWSILQSGFRRFTDQLLADVEVKVAVAPSSFQVLWFLLTSPDRTARMHQLTHALGFSTAGTTKLADRLAEAGLIERSPSPADRRVIYATLTEHGVQVATNAALALAEALRERVVRPLGKHRLESLAAAISSLDPKHGQGRD
ncbi:MAG TPA: MarR family transcriptional regulator [Streptosporangiaceae bacterium]